MNKRERFFSAASAGIFTAVTVCVLAVVLLTPPARYSLTDKPYLLGNLPLLLLFLPYLRSSQNPLHRYMHLQFLH